MSRVRVILREQIIQTVLWIGGKLRRQFKSNTPETRRTDGHQKRSHSLPIFAQILETGLD
jgi:hypothetical protein